MKWFLNHRGAEAPRKTEIQPQMTQIAQIKIISLPQICVHLCHLWLDRILCASVPLWFSKSISPDLTASYVR